MTAVPPFNDKRGVLRTPESLRDLKLELGCGPNRRYPDSIAVDTVDHEFVDIVGDAGLVLRNFPDACAALVTSSHFLEHVGDPAEMIGEMARVLQPGGTIEIVVPHFSHPYYYSDPTHVRAPGYGLYTMSYYARDPIFRRKVPTYVRYEHLTLDRVDLRFKSTIPFYGRHAIKRVMGLLFNSCVYLQEFWEENLCYILPCYEIRYVLRHAADAQGS